MHPIGVPSLPPNNPTYSQAWQVGNLIFVSGQLGVHPHTRDVVDGGIIPETRQALENVATVLAAAGASLENVAKVNIYITDFSLLGEMNSVYAQYLPHRPAKTTVEVCRLDRNARIEIEVVATVPSQC